MVLEGQRDGFVAPEDHSLNSFPDISVETIAELSEFRNECDEDALGCEINLHHVISSFSSGRDVFCHDATIISPSKCVNVSSMSSLSHFLLFLSNQSHHMVTQS